MTIEHTPPRTRLDDDKFMEVWHRMDPALQRECLRAEREILEGIAIYKDRMMGRAKKAAGGFYSLEQAEAEVYALEQVGRKAAELARARAHVSELRASLADEAREIERRMAAADEMEEHAKHAEAQGLTLAGYIRKCRGIEQTLNRDILEGLFMICDWVKVDPIQTLHGMLDSPDRRQVAH